MEKQNSRSKTINSTSKELKLGPAKLTYSGRSSYYVKKPKSNLLKVNIPQELTKNGTDSSKTNEKSTRKIVVSSSQTKPKNNNFFPEIDLEMEFGFQLIPLIFFDDSNLETVDLNKLSQKIENDEIVTGSSISFNNYKEEWKQVLILGMSPDRSTFYVEFCDSDIRKFVSRLNLIISGENRDKFFERRRKAEKTRESFMRYERFYAYIDQTLNPMESYIKPSNFKMLLAKIKPKLLTNYSRVSKIFREVCMLDVTTTYVANYKKNLNQNKKVAKEFEKRNFPVLSDFPSAFICLPKVIITNVDIKKEADMIKSIGQIISIKQKARSLINFRFIEFDETITDVIQFCRKVQNVVKYNISTTFVSTISSIVKQIKNITFFNQEMAKTIDHIVITTISEIINNLLKEFYDYIDNKVSPFKKTFTDKIEMSLSAEIAALHQTVDVLVYSWEEANVFRIGGLFEMDNDCYRPNMEMIQPQMDSLLKFLDEIVIPPIQLIHEKVTEFDQKFRYGFYYDFYEVQRIIECMDLDSAVMMHQFSKNSIPPTQMLTHDMINDFIQINNEILQLIEELVSMKTTYYTKLLVINFTHLAREALHGLEYVSKAIFMKLYLHCMSEIESLYCVLEFTKNLLTVEPVDLSSFIVLKNDMDRAFEILKKMNKDISFVQSVIEELSNNSFPFTLKVQQFMFEFRLYLSKFTKTLPLRQTELKERRIIIKNEYDLKENQLLFIYTDLDLELGVLLRQGFTKNISSIAERTVVLNDRFNQAVEDFHEIKRGDKYLERQTFDETNLLEGQRLSLCLRKLWVATAEYSSENEKIAGTQIQAINTKDVSEKFARWVASIKDACEGLKDFPIPRNVALLVENNVSNFNSYIPIINALGSIYLRNRHWIKINELFQIDHPLDTSATLYYLIDIIVLDKQKEIMDIVYVAEQEYILEDFLDASIANFYDWTFSLTLFNAPKFIQTGISKLQDQVKDIRKVKHSKYREPFEQQLEKHENFVTQMQAFVNLVRKTYDLYIYQSDFMEADDTQKHQYAFYPTFGDLKEAVTELWSKCTCCVLSISMIEKLEAIYVKFKELKEKIYPYLQSRRKEYYRLQFLGNSELFSYIASTKSPERFSEQVKNLFPSLDGIVIESNKIVAVLGKNEERLDISPIEYDTKDVPLLLKTIENRIEDVLMSTILDCADKSEKYLIDRMSTVTYQELFVILNIKFTKYVKNIIGEREFNQVCNRLMNFKKSINMACTNYVTIDSIDSLFDYYELILNQIASLNKWSFKLNQKAAQRKKITMSTFTETNQLKPVPSQPSIPEFGSSSSLMNIFGSPSSINASFPKFQLSESPSPSQIFGSPLSVNMSSPKFQLSESPTTPPKPIQKSPSSIKFASPLLSAEQTTSETSETDYTYVSATSSLSNFKNNAIKPFNSAFFKVGEERALQQNYFARTITLPDFPQFLLKDSKVVINFKKYSINYGFEFIPNTFKMDDMPTFDELLSFVEASSYNGSCAIIHDSIIANKFVNFAANFMGKYAFGVHCSSDYFEAKKNQFLNSLEIEKVWIHLEDFDYMDSSTQLDIAYSLMNDINGILITSGLFISQVLYTFLRPIIIDEDISSWQFNVVVGTNQNDNKNAIIEHFKTNENKIIEIFSRDDIEKKFIEEDSIIWYHHHPMMSDSSIFEEFPYFELENSSRIKLNRDTKFVFEVSSAERIPTNLADYCNLITYKAIDSEFWDLYNIFTQDIVNFFIGQAKIYSSLKNAIFTQYLCALLTSYNPQEKNRVCNALKIDYDKLELSDVIFSCLSSKESIIIFGNTKIKMMNWLYSFLYKYCDDFSFVFDAEEATESNVCIITHEIDFKTLNKQFQYLILLPDYQVFSFELAYRYVFCPGALIKNTSTQICKSLNEMIESLTKVQNSISIICNSKKEINIDNSYTINDENDIKNLQKCFNANKNIVVLRHPTTTVPNLLKIKYQKEGDEKMKEKEYFRRLLEIKFVFISPFKSSSVEFFDQSLTCEASFIFEEEDENIEKFFIDKFSFATELASRVYSGKSFLNAVERIRKYTYDLYNYLKPIIQKEIERNEAIINNLNCLVEYENSCNKEISDIKDTIKQLEIQIEHFNKAIEGANAELSNAIKISNFEHNKFDEEFENLNNDHSKAQERLEYLMPQIEKSILFIKNIDTNSIQMFKAIRSPTPSILPLFQAFSVLYDVQPNVTETGNKKNFDYFTPMQKFIQSSNFANTMSSFADSFITRSKLYKIKKILSDGGGLLDRASKVNKDFSNIVKWFHMIIFYNEESENIRPLREKERMLALRINEIAKHFEALEKSVKLCESKRDDMISLRDSTIKRKSDTETLLVVKETNIAKVKKMNKRVTTEIETAQSEANIYKKDLDNLVETSFVTSLSVNVLSAMNYNQHKQHRSHVCKQVSEIKIKEINFGRFYYLKIRELGINDDTILAEKFASVLNPLRTPVIFDPTGFCFYILKYLVPESQIISSRYDKISVEDPIILISDDFIDILHFIDMPNNHNVFIFTSVEFDKVPQHIQNSTIFVNFANVNLTCVFSKLISKSKTKIDFTYLISLEDKKSEYEKTIDKVSSSISNVFNSQKQAFFSTERWKSFKDIIKDNRQKLSECNTKIIETSTKIKNLEEYDQENGSNINHLFFDIISKTYIFRVSPLFSLFASKLSNGDFHNIEEFQKKIIFDFCLSMNDSVVDIDNSYIVDYESFKYDMTKFNLCDFIFNHSCDVPIIINCNASSDPTNILMQINNTKVINSYSNDLDKQFYRNRGIVVIRFPEFCEIGFTQISSFIGNLISLHSFPPEFRLVILTTINKPDIPVFMSSLCFFTTWPPLCPPSVIHGKSNMTMLTSNLLMPFFRPTIVTDSISYDIIRAISFSKYLPDISIPPEFIDIDRFWLMNYKSLKQITRTQGLDIFEGRSLKISLTSFEGCIEVNTIYGMNCFYDDIANCLYQQITIYPRHIPKLYVGVYETDPENYNCELLSCSYRSSCNVYMEDYSDLVFIY